MRLVNWLLSPIVRLLELCLYKLAEVEEMHLVEDDPTAPPGSALASVHVPVHMSCFDAYSDGAGYTCPPCAALLRARMPKETAA